MSMPRWSQAPEAERAGLPGLLVCCGRLKHERGIVFIECDATAHAVALCLASCQCASVRCCHLFEAIRQRSMPSISICYGCMPGISSVPILINWHAATIYYSSRMDITNAAKVNAAGTYIDCLTAHFPEPLKVAAAEALPAWCCGVANESSTEASSCRCP